MKILIVPEDQTYDSFVVKPVVEALLKDAGISARVNVLPEPRLRGASDALDPVLIREIVEDNPMIDVFVLIVDRDCDRQRNEAKAQAREREHPGRLIACLAKQEVEIWLLALHKDWLDAPWQEVRSHCDPKEAFAEPLLRTLGTDGPGAGRKKAMRKLAGNLRSLLTLCDELAELQSRLSVRGGE